MKNITKILMSMFAVVALASCNTDEQDQYVGGNDGLLSIGDMVIHPLGDEVTVSFTAFESWDIIENVDWVKANKYSGSNGTYEIIFTIEPYIGKKDNSDRNVNITFQNRITKETIDAFTISQSVAYIEIDNSDDIPFSWDKETSRNTITVNSSIECKITVEDLGIKTGWIYINGQIVTQENPIYFGELATDETNDFVFSAVDYNFNVDYNEAKVMIEPVMRNSNGEEITIDQSTINMIAKSINVTQDYLIFTVHEGNINEVYGKLADKDNVLNKSLDLTGFDELGYNYLQSNESDEDDNDASKVITIAIEDAYSYNENELYDDSNDEYEFYSTSDDIRTVTIADRDIRFKEYNVRVLKPNDKLNEEREIPVEMSLVGYSNSSEVPKMKFNLVQDGYTFKLVGPSNQEVSSAHFDNMGNEYKTYTLVTNGPWHLSDYAKEWLQCDTFDYEDGIASGIGNVEFVLNVPERNMSFDEDNIAELVFSTGNFGGDLATPYTAKLEAKQDKFEFDIKTTNANDSRSLKLTSSNTKLHNISIASSGPWELEVDDSSDWLTLSNIDEGNGCYAGVGNLEFNIQAQLNSGDLPRSKTLKLISTLHRDANWDEDEYTREIVITQDELHCAILTEENGTDFSGCKMLAYSKNGLSHKFYLDCSVPWEVSSKPEWLDLYHGSSKITSGDGSEYLTIRMDVKTNTNSDERRKTIKILADINADGEFNGVYDRELSFDVSQDGFVFDVVAESSYNYDAINEKSADIFTVTTTKDAGINVKANDDWAGCTKIGSTVSDDDKTETFTYAIQPDHNIGSSNINKTRNSVIAVSSVVSGASKNITLNQAAFIFKTDKEKLDIFDEIDPKDQTLRVTECTGNYYEAKVSDWLEYDNNKVEPKGNNIDRSAREGKVEFIIKHDAIKDKERVVLKSFDVKQRGYTWEVKNEGSSSISALGDSDITLIINSSGEWEIKCDEGVTANLDSDQGANGGKKSEVKLTFAPNYSTSTKTLKVAVECKDNENFSEELTFTQDAYKFDVKVGNDAVGNSGYTKTIASGGESFDINVDCTDVKAWEYSCSADWIKVQKSDKKLSITVDSNESDKTTEARETTIEIKTTDGSKMSRTVTVKQEGYTPLK